MEMCEFRVNPIKLDTGLRPNSAGITYTLLLRIEAMGFPTFGLLLYGALRSLLGRALGPFIFPLVGLIGSY